MAEIIADWAELSVLCAFLSVLVALLLYMISKIFSIPKLSQDAKSEMIFAASTVFLVLFTISVLAFAEDVATQFLLGFYDYNVDVLGYIQDQNINPNSSYDANSDFAARAIDIENSTADIHFIDILIVYLNSLAGCMTKVLNFVWGVDIFVSGFASVLVETFMSELSTGFFVKYFAERVSTITNGLNFYLIMFYLMYHILMFLKYLGLSFFVLGVVLRAFPPTRGAGAYIMALTIGLYFIFPISYVTMAFITVSQKPAGCYLPDIPLPEKSTCGSLDPSKISENQIYLEINKESITDYFDYLSFSFMRQLTLNMCCLPIIAITLTLSFILSTSSLFGATIPEVGRGLIKLI